MLHVTFGAVINRSGQSQVSGARSLCYANDFLAVASHLICNHKAVVRYINPPFLCGLIFCLLGL